MKRSIAILVLLSVALSSPGCVTIEHTTETVANLPQLSPSPETSDVPSPTPEPEIDDGSDDIHLPELTPEPEPEAGPLSGYAAAAAMYLEITDAMRNVILSMPEVYEKEYPPGLIKNEVFPTSFYMTYTKDFCEDQARLDEALNFWMDEERVKDAQFSHDAPNDYKLNGTWMSMDATFVVSCK